MPLWWGQIVVDRRVDRATPCASKQAGPPATAPGNHEDVYAGELR
jgi:hypothetical protein